MTKYPRILHRRDTYIEKIKPFMRTPIIKVMVGHRRVGKSFILFQLIELIKSEEKDANIIYINKEDIDFVCTRGGETLYIQVTVELSMPETIEREFGNLLKIRDNYPKIVVSGERSFENSYEGVEHIYIRDFLSSTLTPKIL